MKKPAQRENVKGNLRTAILQEALAICPFCGLEKLGSLQVHHIDGNPANTVMENLIAICASCHEQITKGLISEAEVMTKKRMLQFGAHPFAKKNHAFGNAVHFSGINNQGIIANKVTVNGKVAGKIIIPGTIGSDPKKYNYVEYLVKRLTKFREAGGSYGQKRKGKIHDGGTRKILAEQFGGLPKDQPLERFEQIIAHIKEKIDNTALGRNRFKQTKRNYHEFNEHGLSNEIGE